MRSLRTFWSSSAVVTASIAAAGLLSGQSNTETERHIQQIQNALVPAVITNGEAPATSSLADRMAALHVPGVSIAVIHGGKIEWARGFGVTRIDGPAVTPETLFQAASISKPVTAMAALHLVESGKLDLDTNVNQFLKTWKLPENSFTEKTKVTLRELLTHTAGMTVHGFGGYAPTDALPTLVQILNGEKPANSPPIRVDTVPGMEWRYSGGGFVVTQLVLQDVSGQPFPKLMQDLVLAPAGMTHSTYEQPLPAARMVQTATPYRQNGQPVPGGAHVYPEMSAAGLWTTPSDLARFAMEIQRSLTGKSGGILSLAMARAMLKPGRGDWGLGIGIGGNSAHPWFRHGGANEGFQCDMVAFDNGDGAVIMTNSDSGTQLMPEILRTIAYEYRWPDFGPREIGQPDLTLSSEILSRYAGVYQMQPGVSMTITLRGGQLISRMTRQNEIPLFAESQTMFHPKVVDARIEFPASETGPASQLILHQNGRDVTAKRLSDADAKKVVDAQAAFDERFKDQTAAPGSEAALRRMIEELRTGKPDYAQMSPMLASATRQQLPELQPMIAELGPLQSIAFTGVGPGGADIYQVKFEKGALEYRIWLSEDGKVDSAGVRRVD
jgi:CubicO group peptidase (beta-lactamase class C family)